MTDVGALAALLAYAADVDGEVFGKPSRLLFETIAESANVPLDRMAMVGDDAELDVAASIDLELEGVLVRLGKYRPGAEERVTSRPTAVLDSVADLPDWVGIGPSR